MNTIFIKIFFSIVCLLSLIHIWSFAVFEIKENKNVYGGIFTILFAIFSVVFSNVLFWLD